MKSTPEQRKKWREQNALRKEWRKQYIKENKEIILNSHKDWRLKTGRTKTLDKKRCEQNSKVVMGSYYEKLAELLLGDCENMNKQNHKSPYDIKSNGFNIDVKARNQTLGRKYWNGWDFTPTNDTTDFLLAFLLIEDEIKNILLIPVKGKKVRSIPFDLGIYSKYRVNCDLTMS
jgi:hypothetical protein